MQVSNLHSLFQDVTYVELRLVNSLPSFLEEVYFDKVQGSYNPHSYPRPLS